MSELITASRTIYGGLDSARLTDNIFRREPGKYYPLINYPPLKGMSEHNEQHFSFVKPSTNSRRLYVHIPFCTGQCTFCNYRIIVGATERQPYLNSLVAELDILLRDYFPKMDVDNLWVGGGTPSLLSLHELEFLYSNILKRITMTTPYSGMDLHPEMVNEPDCAEKLRLLHQMGLNRVNLGIQSFDGEVLRASNRRHTARDSRKLIEMCQEVGFDFINFDLILGLPRQTLDSWEDTLEQALRYEPTSFSPFYCWMKPASPIYRHYQRRPQDFPSRDDWFLMIVMYMEAFERQGYQFGTIEYYFKPRPAMAEAQPLEFGTFLHTDFDVIPLGISGYGLSGETRYMNHLNLDLYYQTIAEGRLSIFRYAPLPQDEIVRLNLMYAVRYNYVNRAEFERRYGIDVVDYFADEFRRLQELGLVDVQPAAVTLTYLGKVFCDEVCMFFVSPRVLAAIREDERRPDRDSEMLETYSYLYDVAHVDGDA